VTIVSDLKKAVNRGGFLERLFTLCIVEQNLRGRKQALEKSVLELSLLVMFLLWDITGSKQ
jgi:hypothetical protein